MFDWWDEYPKLRPLVIVLALITILGIMRLFQGLVPQPTSTPSPGPLPITLVEPGDLPSGLRAEPSPIPWRIYPGMPTSGVARYFEVIEGPDDRNEVGHISVVRYPSDDDLDAAYQSILGEIGPNAKPQNRVGELAVSSGPSADWSGSDVAFIRCGTVAHVSLPGPLGPAELLAGRIDARLREYVC